MMTDEDEERVLDMLWEIHAGKLSVSAPDGIPEDVFYGDITFVTSNGWKVTVFADGDSFDFIDQVTTPEGILWDFDDFWRLAEAADGEITPRMDGWNRVRNYRGCACDLTTPQVRHHRPYTGSWWRALWRDECKEETVRVWSIPWDGQEEAAKAE